MHGPQPQSGWVAVAVAMALVGGCAARQPSPTMAGRLVKGADGPGGVAWPTAPGTGTTPVVAADVAPLSEAQRDQLSAGPRARQGAEGARVLEESDERLRGALEAAAGQPDAAALRVVAREYRRLGVFDKAHGYLVRALALDPEDGQTHDALARLWRDWGLPAEGLSGAYRAVAAAPESAEAQNTLGTVLYALGHVEAARERFERAVAIDGAAAYAWNNLCHVTLMAGDDTRALAECRQALALDPGLAAAQNNLGLVHAAAGRWQDAAVAFTLAAGDEAVGRYNLGVAYMSRGEHALAADAFEAALALRPTFELARRRAAEARRLAEGTPGPADRKHNYGRD